MTILDQYEADLTKVLGRLERRTKFVELLAEGGTGEDLRVETKATTLTPAPHLRGVIFRAWTGQRWAEAATSQLDAAHLNLTVESLEAECARSTGTAPPPGISATTRGSWVTSAKRSLRELGPEGMLGLARDIRGWATAVPSIGEVIVRVAWSQDERLYLNSVGARCHQSTERSYMAVAPIAIENGRSEVDYRAAGAVGGLERLRPMDEPLVRATAESSRAMLAAKAPPAGETDVVLDPGVTGTFAHESFGHGTEADQFLRDRSYLKPILGQVVGPEFLSIVDDGSIEGGWGSVYCDDEGHPGHRTPLIERGRFVGALHDRETAAALGAHATGNTRRSDFLSRAFVRMTNTLVEPGDRTLEELLREVKHGVLLEHWMSGIEDPLGGQMQIKVRKGHRIENGHLTDLVGPMALSGKVLEFLRSIRGIERARDPLEMEPGFCGKGHSDYIPVGSGGTHLLSRAIVGPA